MMQNDTKVRLRQGLQQVPRMPPKLWGQRSTAESLPGRPNFLIKYFVELQKIINHY